MTGIKAHDLRQHIIRPTLTFLNLSPDVNNSKPAEILLLATAAIESDCGAQLKQMNGPALGMYQIEPNTQQDLWAHYTAHHPMLIQRLETLLPLHTRGSHKDLALIDNLSYATAMARLIYYRVKQPLPSANDVDALAHYWKQHYNTAQGKGTVTQFKARFHTVYEALA